MRDPVIKITLAISTSTAVKHSAAHSRPIFSLDAMRAATQLPVTRNSQITENLLKSSFSQEPSRTYSQLFYGK